MKCVICQWRPAKANGYCVNCNGKLEAGKRNNHEPKPTKYLVYRGNVVGLVPSGNGKLKVVRSGVNPDRLPKAITLNLDKYCEGYTREVIKSFKAAVLKVYAA